ncbi:MAG: TOMM precursor leader peptide-binding protein [Endozoicomonas sp.]
MNALSWRSVRTVSVVQSAAQEVKGLTMDRLRLTPAASISPNKDGVLLQSDLGAFQLHGADVSAFVTDIVPLLQGQHDLAGICSALERYDDDSIESLINLLVDHGLVERDRPDCLEPPWPAHQRFLKAWSVAENRPEANLQNARVLVIGLEPWSVKMVDELAHCGLGHIHIIDGETVSEDDVLCHRELGRDSIHSNRAEALKNCIGKTSPWCDISYEPLQLNDNEAFLPTRKENWDLVIVTLASEAQYFLKEVSAYIQQQGFRTLYGTIDGLESWLGPVVVPGETACWNCLRLRRLGAAANPELSHALENSVLENRQTHRGRSMLSPMAAVNGQQLAMEALKLLLDYTASDLYSQVSVHNLITNKADSHGIIPVPGCDVCNGTVEVVDDETSEEPAATVVSEQKTNPLNQLSSLEELKKLFKGWVDPVTGIIRHLNGHLGHLPDFPITASASVSTFTEGQFDPRGMGQVGSGKGLDEISAHISAIGEAIERYSAARFDKSKLKYASINQLDGPYLDPEDLVLYGKKQYQSQGFPFVPWRRKQKIHWVKGRSLGKDEPVWVPALVSYFNFSCPYEEQFSQVSSNGLAAGQDNDDAAIRACYELIERDAMMLSWYAQLPCQRLHIDSQYEGKMRLLIDEITSKGVQLELYLLDVGLHVPTVVCLAFGDGRYTPAVSVALSCHGDIHVAMRKALLEQGHVMPYLCHLMATSTSFPRHSHEVRSLEDHAAYYFMSDKQQAFDFMRQPLESAVHPDAWGYGRIRNIQDLRDRITGAGVDIAVVDVTSTDVSLSPFRVARAVGRHMQPIHFGEQFRRFDNPRLRRLLKGRPVNDNPHPIA